MALPIDLFCCAGIIACDIAFNDRRQPMGVINFVFPITALYFGPLALALYWRWGRADAPAMAPMPMSRPAASQAAASRGGSMQARGGQSAHHQTAGAAGQGVADEPPPPPGERTRPWWVTMAIEVSHCGAGCSLGDVISEFAIFGLGLTIAGTALLAEYPGVAIAPVRGLGLKDGLIAAAKRQQYRRDDEAEETGGPGRACPRFGPAASTGTARPASPPRCTEGSSA